MPSVDGYDTFLETRIVSLQSTNCDRLQINIYLFAENLIRLTCTLSSIRESADISDIEFG